jgi:S-DNA-T family DNA segregation ATPase FtsK/SpoIIIE
MRSSRSVHATVADGAIRRLIHRNLAAFAGLGALAAAAAVAASLATWSVDDPSLSHTTDHAVRNVLGYPGAILADLLTQFLGLSAPLLLLAPVIWAWRAVFGAPSHFALRTVVTAILCTLAGALALAMIPIPASWALTTGLGGLVGDLLRNVVSGAAGGLGAWRAVAAGAASASLALAFGLHAIGLIGIRRRSKGTPVNRVFDPNNVPDADEVDAPPPSEEDTEIGEEDPDADVRPSRWSVAIGALGHLMLRVGGAVRRHLKRRAVPPPPIAADDFGRIEPKLAPDYDDMGLDEDDDAGPPIDLDDEDDVEAAPAPRAKAAKKPRDAARRIKVQGAFELPPIGLLSEPKPGERKTTVNTAALQENAHILEGVLDDFGVKGEIVNVRPGPVVALYELEPAPGIKSSRVVGLADDIARSMSAVSARVAVIPGKNAIGIELPNQKRETVYLRELLAANDFRQSTARLPLGLGKSIGGEPVIVDLARMPHLLVAGTTGSGKSVSINTMILSLLYRLTPQECRMIMIDPKMLELSIYDGIPHLLSPVVTDPKKAVMALKWTVKEMEDRYRKMSKLGVRNIDGYNARLADALSKGEQLSRTVQTGFDPDTGEAIYEKEALSLEPLPFIVVIIDEMADLMIVAGKDIEGAVQRLAQMARAAGIHVIMATQRPSVDVITGTIKANFPTRISFQVTSKIDSRTILNEMGAEQLLGQGDMLYMAGGGRIQRVHGPFVSDREVEDVVAHLKTQGTPEYLTAVTADDGEGEDGEFGGGGALGEEDSADLYDQAVAVVIRDRKASTSYIQRRLQIGYNRAASIIERMEKEGVVGAANHAGKREILVEDHDALE